MRKLPPKMHQKLYICELLTHLFLHTYIHTYIHRYILTYELSCIWHNNFTGFVCLLNFLRYIVCPQMNSYILLCIDVIFILNHWDVVASARSWMNVWIWSSKITHICCRLCALCTAPTHPGKIFLWFTHFIKAAPEAFFRTKIHQIPFGSGELTVLPQTPTWTFLQLVNCDEFFTMNCSVTLYV